MLEYNSGFSLTDRIILNYKMNIFIAKTMFNYNYQFSLTILQSSKFAFVTMSLYTCNIISLVKGLYKGNCIKMYKDRLIRVGRQMTAYWSISVGICSCALCVFS